MIKIFIIIIKLPHNKLVSLGFLNEFVSYHFLIHNHKKIIIINKNIYIYIGGPVTGKLIIR